MMQQTSAGSAKAPAHSPVKPSATTSAKPTSPPIPPAPRAPSPNQIGNASKNSALNTTQPASSTRTSSRRNRSLMDIACPNCGETFDLNVEPQEAEFIIDCEICCRPM